MVPDLMSIQADGKIPIDLVDSGSAPNSQLKEERKGDCRQILSVHGLFLVLHRSRRIEGFLALAFSSAMKDPTYEELKDLGV